MICLEKITLSAGEWTQEAKVSEWSTVGYSGVLLGYSVRDDEEKDWREPQSPFNNPS